MSSAAGTPTHELEGEAAERAFGVAIRGLPVGYGSERLWRFEEKPAASSLSTQK